MSSKYVDSEKKYPIPIPLWLWIINNLWGKKKERIHSRADKLWLKKYQFLLRENSQRADWSMVKGKSDFSIEENASPLNGIIKLQLEFFITDYNQL